MWGLEHLHEYKYQPGYLSVSQSPCADPPGGSYPVMLSSNENLLLSPTGEVNKGRRWHNEEGAVPSDIEAQHLFGTAGVINLSGYMVLLKGEKDCIYITRNTPTS